VQGARLNPIWINIIQYGITIKKNLQTRPDLKAIGRRIRELRGFDCTQAEFGKILGISQAQLSKYEKAQRFPNIELLLKLKAHSGRSIDWILTGEQGQRAE
jgi:DNA-binding XRE family transcriptional regulator